MSELERYLGDRDPQELRERLERELEPDAVTDILLERYEQWISEEASMWSAPSREGKYYAGHKRILELMEGVAYAPSAVRNLSVRLARYRDDDTFHWSGFFLSGLINAGPDEEYEILTAHLENPYDMIGYSNRKHITVIGDTAYPGYLMSSGVVVVHGDVTNAGFFMTGGELHILGDEAHISRWWMGGKIYHKGVLIKGDPDE